MLLDSRHISTGWPDGKKENMRVIRTTMVDLSPGGFPSYYLRGLYLQGNFEPLRARGFLTASQLRLKVKEILTGRRQQHGHATCAHQGFTNSMKKLSKRLRPFKKMLLFFFLIYIYIYFDQEETFLELSKSFIPLIILFLKKYSDINSSSIFLWKCIFIQTFNSVNIFLYEYTFPLRIFKK